MENKDNGFSKRLLLAKEILLTKPEILTTTLEDEDFFESEKYGKYVKFEYIDGYKEYALGGSAQGEMRYNLKNNAKDQQLVRAAYSIADELIRQEKLINENIEN